MQSQNVSGSSLPPSFLCSPQGTATGTSSGSIRQKDVQRLLSQEAARERQSLDQFSVKHAPPDASLRPTASSEALDTDYPDQPPLRLMLQPDLLEDIYQNNNPVPLEDIDVMQALPPGMLSFSAWSELHAALPKEDSFEPSTQESVISTSDSNSPSFEILSQAPAKHPEEDQSFFDITATLIPGSPPSVTNQKSASRQQAWQQLHRKIEEHFSNSDFLGSDAFHTALHHWVAQFSCVLNPEKVTAALINQAHNTHSPDELQNLISGFMVKYHVAETLTPTHPDTVFEHLENPCQALQALLVYRHKLVSETTEENYSQVVEKLDHLIQTTLTAQFGDLLRSRTGLDIDTEKPDYAHFSRLADIAGHATPADGLDKCILSEAQSDPKGDLATLISLDAWLTEHSDAPNMVIWTLGAALLPAFLTLNEQLQLTHTDWTPEENGWTTISAPLSGKKSERHVRFQDQPGVIPSDQARGLKPSQPIEDMTTPERSGLPSHFSVQYFNALHNVRQKLEQQPHSARNSQARQWLASCQDFSQRAVGVQQKRDGYLKQYPNPAERPENIKKILDNQNKAITTHRTTALAFMDKLLEHSHGTQVNKEARKAWLSSLSFVKAGLVDAEQLINNHEEYLSIMVVKSMQPRRSKANGNVVRQHTGFADTSEDGEKTEGSRALKPGKPLRALPNTAEQISVLSALTRPYHQAMEVPLKPPADFLSTLRTVTDPKVMLPLLIRLKRENAPAFLITSWNQRMKEVMLEHCAQRVVTEMNKNMATPEEETQAEQEITLQVQTTVREQLSSLRNSPPYSWLNESGYDTNLEWIWESELQKPDDVPDTAYDMLRRFLPSGTEIANYLQANMMVLDVS